MTSIEIELTRVEGELRVDHDKIPEALINAIMDQRTRYPEVVNQADYEAFDRLFEQEHNCRIVYGARGKAEPDRVVWDNSRDYTLFVLKWSSI
ncbi:hypothetical protein UFOVP181_475 [uncultured Caudovirales phage]|uniref:Uncharacterized protein n=1 Tax=uncultured Caudovirales phage TaxID=2100421 RepID=A0A6J5L0I7_9CAUD|nr:hypothetical protein UFOVP57_166 [uncultured Caudovirales phage]CAB5209436.1 hypothetical protein UFOVP181_475 [uncultured Caudovirales phage]